jgi:RNA polymerase sigma factor (sigma-70 family)
MGHAMTRKLLDGTLTYLRGVAAIQALQELGDRELLTRFVREQEEAAFTVLVERHSPMVLSICRRALHHDHDAEDACQATFLVLACRARSLRKVASLRSWLHGVARRVAANLRRERERRQRRERHAFTPVPSTPPAETSWREVQAVLEEELHGLPERLRLPLILCYLDGLTRDEAARRLNVSPGCLHGRLERGRRRLHDRLAQRGFTLSTAFLAAALGEGVSRAALSPTLILASTRAAVLLASSQPVAEGLIPAPILSLTRGVLKEMLWTNVKLGLSLALGVGLLLATFAFSLSLMGSADNAKADPPLSPAEASPPQASPHLDADGRPLPGGAVFRIGSRRFRVEGRSDFIFPTPDGKHVLVHPNPSISGYPAQGLMLLDAKTGLREREFEDSRRVAKSYLYGTIQPAAFSPDGKKLYALAWHKSEEARNEFRVWATPNNPCKRVILVWDVATGRKTAEWELPAAAAPGESLIAVYLSLDGKRLYVSGAIGMKAMARRVRGAKGVHVLDTRTGRPLQTWAGAGHPVGMTADGKALITFQEEAALTARDVDSGKPLRTFPVGEFVSGVALSPDGKTLAAVGPVKKADPQSYEINLWEANTGRKVGQLQPGPQAVRYWRAPLVFSADGRTLYLGAGTGRIERWDVATGRALPGWPAHHGRIADLHRRPGTGELISAGASDGSVRRWNAGTGKATSTSNAYTGEIAATLTPDGKTLVVVDALGKLELWDITTRRIIKTLQTPGRNRHRLLTTPSGKEVLLAAEFGPSTIWNLSSGKQVGTLVPPPRKDPKARDAYWGTLGFTPDGKGLFASRFGRGMWMWTWPERKVLWHLAGEKESCFFPDGRSLACAEWYGPIEIYDPQTGKKKQTIPHPGVTDIAYSHDRRRIATASIDGSWRVQDASTGEVLQEKKLFQYAWAVTFSPSGWLLAVAGDNAVRVYDTASWAEVARCDGHGGTVRSLFFGEDDWTLVSVSREEGTALVWSLKPKDKREPPTPAQLWADLAGDGPAVQRAVWAVTQQPDLAIRLFRDRWPIPNTVIPPERIRQLIADLDSPTFKKREAATRELERLGRRAETALREAEERGSAEVKRRIKRILARLAPHPGTYSAEQARELRAVWALELAGTPEAEKLLKEWAEARVGTCLCEEADAARKRLRGRR